MVQSLSFVRVEFKTSRKLFIVSNADTLSKLELNLKELAVTAVTSSEYPSNRLVIVFDSLSIVTPSTSNLEFKAAEV